MTDRRVHSPHPQYRDALHPLCGAGGTTIVSARGTTCQACRNRMGFDHDLHEAMIRTTELEAWVPEGYIFDEDNETQATQVTLFGNVDPKVWATEFIKTVTSNPAIATDEAAMIGWFANAILAGYDCGSPLGMQFASHHEADRVSDKSIAEYVQQHRS